MCYSLDGSVAFSEGTLRQMFEMSDACIAVAPRVSWGGDVCFTLHDFSSKKSADEKEVKMIRWTCAAILFVLGVICFNGVVENGWVSGFKDRYFEMYVRRMYIFAFCTVFSFGACATVLLWGRVGWITRKIRRDPTRGSDR